MEEAKQVVVLRVLAETVGDIVRKGSECRYRWFVSPSVFAMRKRAARCWKQACLILDWEIRGKTEEEEVPGEARI